MSPMTICLDIGFVCPLGGFKSLSKWGLNILRPNVVAETPPTVYCDHVIFWVVIWPLCIHCIRAVNGPLQRTSIPNLLLCTVQCSTPVHAITSARHLPNQSSWFKKNLTRHFMFQHCQPMRNHHTEQLQGGNGKIYSENVSEQSSSIRLVPPYIISPWCALEPEKLQKTKWAQ